MEKLLLHGEIPVNCYIIRDQNECMIVDPGYQKEVLVEYINENNLEVVGILLTHGHIDHIGALDAFNVPIYLHQNELEILLDNYKNGFTFYNKEIPYDYNQLNLVTVNDGDVIKLNDQEIKVLFTPGHTVGCLCFKINNDLYSGDTLFYETVGRWDFPTGDLKTLQKTIVSLIESLDESTNIYPAHGQPSTINHEKNYNQFYLEWNKLLGQHD